jgi:molybdate transport system substrate-binding protein
MKKILSLFVGLCMVASLAGCSSAGKGSSSAASSAPPAELTIAAAASLTDVTKEIATDYKKVAPNVTLTFTYGASGALQTQIEQGANVDIFMSAAQKQMDSLEKENLLATGTREDLLENKLVLITPKDSKLGIKSYDDVAGSKITKVALGDPASVPAGQYAQQVFTTLKSWDTVKAKVNYGTDVRQVLTWVESGNVDCGVVYSTDAATSKNVTVVCEAPAGSCDKIVYPVAVLKASQNSDAAKAFLTYLKTSPSSAVFKKYGFATL